VLRAPLAALVVVAALAASGCGGGGSSAVGTPPDQYAAGVCGAISDWQKELQSSISTMSSKLSASSTPDEVKGKLVEFMEAATKSTESMLSKVKAAGPPAIDDGAKLQSDLEAGLTKAKNAFAQARDKAKALPTDDPAAFQREATALGTTLTEQGSAIEATFKGLSTKYDSKDLNQAFDEEPACKSL
jgi:type IV pilus biogenesis protein CpaD/CtpE